MTDENDYRFKDDYHYREREEVEHDDPYDWDEPVSQELFEATRNYHRLRQLRKTMSANVPLGSSLATNMSPSADDDDAAVYEDQILEPNDGDGYHYCDICRGYFKGDCACIEPVDEPPDTCF